MRTPNSGVARPTTSRESDKSFIAGPRYTSTNRLMSMTSASTPLNSLLGFGTSALGDDRQTGMAMARRDDTLLAQP